MLSALALTLAALKVVLLAGGIEARENHHSHLVHLQRAQALFEAHGVPAQDITVFFADGPAPGVDRAVVPEPTPPDAWLLAGSRLADLTDPGPVLQDTRWPGARPATAVALRAWFEEVGPSLRPGDTLLVAVTDHGQADPAGGTDSRISLWGDELSVQQLLKDLEAVPEDVRVLLWMSQCYSGGFAGVRARPGACGALSTTADRVAYGCTPELAGREDVGHFLRLLEGLARQGALGPASDEAQLTDDAPDTPHLTSDAFLFEQLSEAARSAQAPLDTFIDDRLAGVDPTHPAWIQVARLAQRYGLGVIRGYGDVLRALDRAGESRYAAQSWLAIWELALHAELKRLAAPVLRRLQDPADRPARLAAREASLQALRAALAADGDRARIEGLQQRVFGLQTLLRQADLQEAAVLRVAYLLGRMAGPAVLDEAGAAQLADLQRCEETPLWTPSAAATPPLPPAAPLPPLERLPSAVEALRPAHLGLNFRDRPGGPVEVTGLEPGSPAQVTSLFPGDRILAVGGLELRRPGDLRAAVLTASVGQPLSLEVLRGHARRTFTAFPAPAPLPAPPPALDQVVPPLGLEPLEPTGTLPAIGEGAGTVLFFWSPTCKPCKQAAPPLARWAAARGARVVAITREPAAEVRRFLRRLSPEAWPFEVALDPKGEAHRLLGVEQTPTFAFVDGHRRLTAWGTGFEGAGPGAIPLDPPGAPAAD